MQGGNYENYHENKSHTTAGFPYNTYLCTIPQDFESVALHWHDDAEIIYIKRGRGIVSVDLEDIRVEAGDIVFILPGRLHSIRSYPNVRMEYENIIFDMEFLSSKLPERMYSEYFTPMLFYTMTTVYRTALQDKRRHPLDMRRYMGVVEY